MSKPVHVYQAFIEASTERVPISTGLPWALSAAARSATADHFASAVAWKRVPSRRRCAGRLVGMCTTGR